MSIDFEYSIEIDRASADVFDFLADFENNPQWQKGMVACRWTSNERMQMGATYVQEARFMGRRIDTHFMVTAFAAERSISIESTLSTFPIQVTRSVEPVGKQRTRVTAHIRGQPSGIFKLFSGLVKRRVSKDYRTLKQLLESQTSQYTDGGATSDNTA